MRVKLAAQVFSHTVAAGISLYSSLPGVLLPSDAGATAELLERMDQLFDSCNGVNFKDVKSNRRPLTATSFHVKFWQDCMKWFSQWKFVGSKAKIYCVDGWRLSLSALLHLWESVNQDLKFIIPRRLNQDCLESYFASIRQKGGFRDNPSAGHLLQCAREWQIISCQVMPMETVKVMMMKFYFALKN